LFGIEFEATQKQMGACISNNEIEYKEEFVLPNSIQKTAPKRHREQLLDVLKHPQLSILFREYLRSIFCVEGYALFMDVEEYKTLTDKAEMEARAKQIFEKYFSADSEYEINVEGALVEMLKEAVNQNPNKETFDLVQQLVLVTIEGTCLPNFLNWKLYLEFINDPITRKVFLGGVSRTRSFLQVEKYCSHQTVLDKQKALEVPSN